MKRFIILGVVLNCVLFMFCGLVIWAANPTGSTVSLTLPLDSDPSALSIRLVPGDRRPLIFTLTNGGSAIANTVYTTYSIYYKNRNGVTLSSQSMILTPSTTLTIQVTPLSTTITSAVTQGLIKCTYQTTCVVIVGCFKIIVPAVQTP